MRRLTRMPPSGSDHAAHCQIQAGPVAAALGQEPPATRKRERFQIAEGETPASSALSENTGTSFGDDIL